MKIFGQIFVLFCIFLFGFFAAHVLRRTSSAIHGFQPATRTAVPGFGPEFASDGFQSKPFAGAGASVWQPRLILINLPLAAQHFAFANAAMADRTVVMDGTTYPWTDAGFSAALAAAGENGTVLLPQGAVVTLTSDHVISTNGTTVDCAPDAGFLSGIDGLNLITITGASDAVLGCRFWGGADPGSNPVFLWNSTGVRLERDTAIGFTGITASFVYLVGAQSSAIQDNQCVAGSGGAGCIFGEKNAVGTTVQSNDLDESAGAAWAHAIAFHSTEPGQTVSDTKILSNQITAGPGYCVEVGAFGGDTPQGLVISANTCKMTADGLGGYSIGSVAKFWTISNNTFDANWFKPSISCVEVAGASDGTVIGNSCDGGNISMSNSQAQRVTISSNLIYDLQGVCAGIYLGTSVEAGAVNDNQVIGNLIHLPPETAAVGIWQQCNGARATCSDNSYSYNTIVSDGSTGSIGIKLENDYGISRNETVGPNTFRAPATAITPVGRVGYTASPIDNPVPAPRKSPFPKTAK